MRHVQNKENYSYKLELHDLNTFIAIVLISGYVNLPRRSMFWECSADIHNDVVFSLMSKNRFDEVMKYLHLAVNTSLTNERFGEVQHLLHKLKEQCLSK